MGPVQPVRLRNREMPKPDVCPTRVCYMCDRSRTILPQIGEKSRSSKSTNCRHCDEKGDNGYHTSHEDGRVRIHSSGEERIDYMIE